MRLRLIFRRVAVKSEGYALLELLVTLAVASLLFVALSGSLSFGAKVWDRGHIKAEEGIAGKNEAILRRLVSLARTPSRGLGGEKPVIPSFQGTSRNLVLITGPLSESARIGLVSVNLTVSEASDREDLVLSWTPLDDADGKVKASTTQDQSETVIVRGVHNITMSYWGRMDDQAEPDWHETWAENRLPPRAVQIKYTNPDKLPSDRTILIPVRLGHYFPLEAAGDNK